MREERHEERTSMPTDHRQELRVLYRNAADLRRPLSSQYVYCTLPAPSSHSAPKSNHHTARMFPVGGPRVQSAVARELRMCLAWLQCLLAACPLCFFQIVSFTVQRLLMNTSPVNTLLAKKRAASRRRTQFSQRNRARRWWHL